MARDVFFSSPRALRKDLFWGRPWGVFGVSRISLETICPGSGLLGQMVASGTSSSAGAFHSRALWGTSWEQFVPGARFGCGWRQDGPRRLQSGPKIATSLPWSLPDRPPRAQASDDDDDDDGDDDDDDVNDNDSW